MSGFDEWSDQALLSSRAYLTSVTSAVYVMASEGTAQLHRSGVIGKNQQENNAAKRLSQLNNGNLKEHAPWRFVFLAPLSSDLAVGLTAAEKALQTALSATFDTDRRSLFYTGDLSLVVATAQQAVAKVLADDQGEDHSKLAAALEAYLEVGARAENRSFSHERAVTAAKEIVFAEMRRSFNLKLARALQNAIKVES
ncbi:hypothetical protein [Sphingomonas aracearum]|uniref:hypothetical protein n=1 Tax=Sphingomonas aracearum TaxID=2283317 RepID=UPI0011C07822|nr:hypothetical protein [Sphingomonas aracearum]